MQQEKIIPSDRELRISKELNAPIALVWKVWTNAEHIANWWGPTAFTNTMFKMDMQAGGEWVFTMHGPDGNPLILFSAEVSAVSNMMGI